MNKDEIQFDLLKTELELTQRQMDKYDQLSMTIKTWAVTLWAASVGWSFQVRRKDIFFVSIVIILVFWFFDALNKMFRENYKKRRGEVANALAQTFKTSAIPTGIVSPQLPVHEWVQGTKRSFFMIHIALPYLLLCAVSVALYSGF